MKDQDKQPFEITINPSKIDYKYLASEIVRGMTNYQLDQHQKKVLEHVSEMVLRNKLQYKAEEITEWIK